MAGTSTVTISGTLVGGNTGSDTFATKSITNTSAAEYTQQINLASGFNSITVPSGVTGAYMLPPPANTQTLTLKGVTGDTGIAISPTAPCVIGFASSPPATIGITAGGTVNNFVIIWI